MVEPSFVNLYVRDFFNLAGRSDGSDAAGGALDRKVAEVRRHAALMDARKGGSHLEAIAAALEGHAGLPSGHGLRRQAGAEWEGRAAFLLRSAALLRRPAPTSATRTERLALRAPA